MLNQDLLRVGIVGGSGYVGGELLRLCLDHPFLDPCLVTSSRLAGRYVASTHPNLRGRTSLQYVTEQELDDVDVLFLCLAHGNAASRMEEFASKARTVIDCSADFRLRDDQAHIETYGKETVASPWRERFHYGLPETNRGRLIELREEPHQLISGVGCNATAVNLALLPLARREWVDHVIADVKVGSSEGGAKANDASHHPERAGAVRSFAPTGHRHQAEIGQELGLNKDQAAMSVTSIEMVRGVLATCHVSLNQSVQDKDLWRAYREVYREEPFVRIVKEKTGLYRLPEPKILAGSNYADVGWVLDSENQRLVVISAIDNLMKGAAGSAVQALNVVRGFDETTGLGFSGLHPC